MKSKAATFGSPLLCLGVLSVLAADNARHVRPSDAADYHQRARAAIESYPYLIGDWTGVDEKVPEAAVKLLRPNALISRRYIYHPPAGEDLLWADLLISQCADSRDMTGHYPPICYPSSGEPQIGKTGRRFQSKVNDLLITGTEYTFAASPGQGFDRKSVYNFFVLPGRGVVPDIADVREAAGDYQRRCFGAAQFQIVQDADQPQGKRDEAFATLIGAATETIKSLQAPK